MKLPIKYIALLVILSLVGIFAYQSYWLVNMYDTMKDQTDIIVMNSIRNADHIELFMRLDSISDANDQKRQTNVKGLRGQISFSASFTNKEEEEEDGVLTTELADDSISALKREQRHLKMGEEGKGLDVGTDFKSIEKMAMSLQKGLHDVIDEAVVGISLVRFDSILSTELLRSNLDIVHYTQLVRTDNDSIMNSTLPASVDTTQMARYEYLYDLSYNNAFRVFTEPTGKYVLRQMRGILVASSVILVILGFSFWYLIRVMLRQKTLEEMKTDFTNNITHELKTPIAVAYAATDALLNFNQAEEKTKRDKYLNIAQDQLGKLSGLVEQILSMSMEKRETFRLKMEEVQVENLIKALVEQHALKAGKQVKFITDIQPEEQTFTTDRTHFSNIISNIIDNAVKYTPHNAVITIKSRMENGMLEISIADNGMGISPDKQKHIFDKFYRVPTGNLHNVKGYGLGLYYVKTMLDKMNGIINLRSEPGKGSEFTLMFNLNN